MSMFRVFNTRLYTVSSIAYYIADKFQYYMFSDSAIGPYISFVLQMTCSNPHFDSQ